MKKFLTFIISAFCIFTAASQQISIMQQGKLNDVLNIIGNSYVDTIDEKKVVEDAIVGMLKALDPHSAYIPPEEVERVNEPLQGGFDGIGIQFQMFEDTLLVVQTIAGCPAEKVGVLPGDRIVYVGDTLIAGVKKQNSDIMKLLRGRRGTEVEVSVKRSGEKNLLKFNIIRDKIPIYSVDAYYMIDNEIGYIRINSFGANTVKEFEDAFTGLKAKGMQSLILSLQGNGGGYLQSAFMLADHFLSGDKIIVYTQGSKQPNYVMQARKEGLFEKGKLIVLVDEYSASASEIVSGAVQDWDRGIVIGRRTFGKGLVQSQKELKDGSLLRLTTARYYTPSGRCIQKPYNDGVEYGKDILERYEHGELFHADSIHFPDSLKYKTLTLNRTVYGGGGIMPDIFVPMDTTQYTEFYRRVVARGFVNKLIVKYVTENGKNLKLKYINFEDYESSFEVGDEFIEKLREEALKAEITVDEDQISLSTPLIKRVIKARIAGDVWTTNEYYKIIDAENRMLQKAVEILQTNVYEEILR